MFTSQAGLYCLTLEYGTDRLFRDVSNYQAVLGDIPEELRCRLSGAKSLKSRITTATGHKALTQRQFP